VRSKFFSPLFTSLSNRLLLQSNHHQKLFHRFFHCSVLFWTIKRVCDLHGLHAIPSRLQSDNASAQVVILRCPICFSHPNTFLHIAIKLYCGALSPMYPFLSKVCLDRWKKNYNSASNFTAIFYGTEYTCGEYSCETEGRTREWRLGGSLFFILNHKRRTHTIFLFSPYRRRINYTRSRWYPRLF